MLVSPTASDNGGAVVSEPLVLSISETAELLGVSDDLVYDLVARGELPCLRLGRRRVIPRAAIELVIHGALDGFDTDVVLRTVSASGSRMEEREAGPRRPRPLGEPEHVADRSAEIAARAVRQLRRRDVLK